MKSIKALLIAIITLMVYQSDTSQTFAEMDKQEWLFLIIFTIWFFIGLYTKIDKN
jgi:hypothetical protein